MPWQVPFVFQLVIAFLIAPVLKKKIVSAPSRTRNLVWQYALTAVLAIATGLAMRAPLWDRRLLFMAAFGVLNAFACYCHWRAIDISLSKSSLFTQGDDLITLGLGYLVLKEGKFLTPLLGMGVALSVGAAIFFTLSKSRSSGTSGGEAGRKLGIGAWVALYCVIWGVEVFFVRFFALDGMSVWAFTAALYFGSVVGALLVFCFAGKKEAGQKLKVGEVMKVAPLSIVNWVAMVLFFWASSLAPITITQPILLVAEMILPTAIGLWWFKEAKELRRIDKLALAIGLAGGLILAFAYHAK